MGCGYEVACKSHSAEFQKGNVPVSAHRLITWLVRKAPVAIRAG